MDYKLSIYFSNGKDLTIVLKDDEFKKFLEDMGKHRPYWNDNKKSGFGVPLFNIMYYTFVEYTEDMKNADAARVKEAQEQINKNINEEKVKEIKEENK